MPKAPARQSVTSNHILMERRGLPHPFSSYDVTSLEQVSLRLTTEPLLGTAHRWYAEHMQFWVPT